MALSPKERLARLPIEARLAVLEDTPVETLLEMEADAWWWTARPEQLPPPGDWFLWLFMGGRGTGKTRAGSEWIVDRARTIPLDLAGNPTEWVVIGQTTEDTRKFNINGPGGMLNVLTKRLGWTDGKEFTFNKSRLEMVFREHGQKIYFEGCDDEDTGRGYTAAGYWLDEICKWRYTDTVWREGIMPGLRANLPYGHRPQVFVSTTPKPIKLLKQWVARAKNPADLAYRLTIGTTFDNMANLSPAMLAEFRREYEGTHIGRQELGGELLDEVRGALWTHALIDACRVKEAPPMLMRTVVGMDPAGTGEGDEMGLVVVGRGGNGEDYVLGDYSRQLAGRAACRRAWEVFAQHHADEIVVEKNEGKKTLEDMLDDTYREMQKEGRFPPGGSPPVKMVWAKDGKKTRATPISLRYEQHRVHHVGTFAELEDQQCTWNPDDRKNPDSPDRVDALVYACLHLREREGGLAEIAEPEDTYQMPIAGLSPLGGGGGYAGPYG